MTLTTNLLLPFKLALSHISNHHTAGTESSSMPCLCDDQVAVGAGRLLHAGRRFGRHPWLAVLDDHWQPPADVLQTHERQLRPGCHLCSWACPAAADSGQACLPNWPPGSASHAQHLWRFGADMTSTPHLWEVVVWVEAPHGQRIAVLLSGQVTPVLKLGKAAAHGPAAAVRSCQNAITIQSALSHYCRLAPPSRLLTLRCCFSAGTAFQAPGGYT